MKIYDYNNIIRTIVILCFAIVVTLLGVSLFSTYSSNVTTGEDFMRFTSVTKIIPFITALAFLILCLKWKDIKFSWSDIVVLCGIGWCWINHTLTEYSLIEDVEQITIFGSIYFIARIFVMADKTSTINIFMTWLLIIGLSELFLGLKQLFGFEVMRHNLGASGSFFNPGPYGGFIAIVFSVALSIVIDKHKKIVALPNIKTSLKEWISFNVLMYVLAWIVITLTVIVLPSTMSRTAWIAAIVASGAIALFDNQVRVKLKSFYTNHRKSVIIGGCIAVLVMSIVSVGIYNIKRGSADGRLLMWKMSARAIIEKPIIGYGGGCFGGVFAKTQADYFANGLGTEEEVMVTGKTSYAFNEYLQICVEYGSVGLVIFLLLLILTIKGYLQCNKSRPLMFGVIALCVFAIASYPLNLTQFCIVFAFMAGIAGKGKYGFGFIYAMITISICFYSIQLNRHLNEKLKYCEVWATEHRYYEMGIYDKQMSDRYAEIYTMLRSNSTFLFEYGHTLNKLGEYAESNKILSEGTHIDSDPMFYNIMGNNFKAIGDIKSASESYYKAYYVMPHRVYSLYLLFNLYYESGQREEAKKIAKIYFQKIPKVMSPAVKQMNSEIGDKLHSIK